MNKSQPANKPVLKGCAAKRKRIECAKDIKFQVFVFAARATSNGHLISFCSFVNY